MRDAIDREIADHALSALEVDAAGLDAMDRRYLTTIAMNYGGGPVGVETMAAALSEPRDAIEDIIEPYPDPVRLSAAYPARPVAHLACIPASRTWPSPRAIPRSSACSAIPRMMTKG